MTEEKKVEFSAKDIEDNKIIAAIGYLGILCLVPVLGKKESKFAMHHGKQGLILFIAEVAMIFVNIIPVLGRFLWFVAGIFFMVMSIMGIIKALNGKAWEIPLIGKYAEKIDL